MISSTLKAYATALSGLLFIVLLCVLSIRSYLIKVTDMKNQQIHSGIATICVLRYPQIGGVGTIPPDVWVHFHGISYEAAYVTGLSRLRLGENARILYCIGKSGQIYVTEVGAP